MVTCQQTTLRFILAWKAGWLSMVVRRVLIPAEAYLMSGKNDDEEQESYNP